MIPAYNGSEPYIFVSYAHKDSEAVYRTIEKLTSLGYRIWYDEGIKPGVEWPENIAIHLDQCSLFMMFISPNSMDSANCRREINFALSRSKKFLCIVLEKTEIPLGMELQLSSQQSIFRYKYNSEEAYIYKICSAAGMAQCKEQHYFESEGRKTAYKAPVSTPAPAAAPVRSAQSGGKKSAASGRQSSRKKSSSKSGSGKSSGNGAVAIGILIGAIIIFAFTFMLFGGFFSGKTGSSANVTPSLTPSATPTVTPSLTPAPSLTPTVTPSLTPTPTSEQQTQVTDNTTDDEDTDTNTGTGTTTEDTTGDTDATDDTDTADNTDATDDTEEEYIVVDGQEERVTSDEIYGNEETDAAYDGTNTAEDEVEAE